MNEIKEKWEKLKMERRSFCWKRRNFKWENKEIGKKRRKARNQVKRKDKVRGRRGTDEKEKRLRKEEKES